MATKIITIHVDDEPVEVTLKSARKDDGLWRAELMMKSSEQMDRMRQIAAFHLYPTCVAAVKEPASVRDMSFDDFMTKIDEADIDAWVGAGTPAGGQTASWYSSPTVASVCDARTNGSVSRAWLLNP